MAQGDLIYDADEGLWYVETGDLGKETPLAALVKSSPYWREVWNVLRIFRVPDDITDEQLDAVTASARRTAEAMLGQEQQGPAEEESEPTARMTYEQAQAFAAQNPDWEPTTQGGWWTVKRVEQSSPAAAPSLLSLDDQIDQFILSGRVDEAQRLWDAEQQVRGGGRLSRQQAAQLVFGAFDDLGDITPQQFKEWIDTLAGPESRQGVGMDRGASDAFFNVDQQAKARGEVPGRLGGGFQGPTGPFGVPLAPGMGTGLATPQQATAAGQGPFTTAPGVEEFDPNFAGASPDAQAALQAEFERRQPFAQQQGTAVAPNQSPFAAPAPLTVTNPLMEALRRREAQLRGTGPSGQPLVDAGANAAGNAAMGGVSTPGPAGQTPATPFQQQQTYEPPFSIAGLSPEAQAAIRGGTASVTQSGPGGNFSPFQAGKGGELLPDMVTPQQQVLNPFEQALFDIGQKQQALKKQRLFQNTRVPTTSYR